ncbi:Smr/MutS family protein [Thiobacter aerophilum]|uniref:Smr/MutS family protein n=1 Tax=Thiobacter aerophilum TaxID=3121275 RepID=A0ABV0EBK7_9BURK
MKPRSGRSSPTKLSQAEVEAFRAAVAGARPLPDSGRIEPMRPRVRPLPRQRLLDERRVLGDLLSDTLPWEEAETGEALRFVRPGLSHQVLRRMRRGHWVIEAELDLHGLTRDEASVHLAEFLQACRKRQLRCVRIVHGKGLGSKNREPVLKHKVRSWLMQRDEVLAFVEARPCDGGIGAVIVMLKAGR